MNAQHVESVSFVFSFYFFPSIASSYYYIHLLYRHLSNYSHLLGKLKKNNKLKTFLFSSFSSEMSHKKIATDRAVIWYDKKKNRFKDDEIINKGDMWMLKIHKWQHAAGEIAAVCRIKFTNIVYFFVSFLRFFRTFESTAHSWLCWCSPYSIYSNAILMDSE